VGSSTFVKNLRRLEHVFELRDAASGIIALAYMGAFEDFIEIVRKTEPMQALIQGLEREPAKLLAAICREYEATKKAVPDHHLNLAGYFGEAVLRALVSANLITREREDRFALYGYKPTDAGVKYYKAMIKEKKI
jgi:hypothetical protein